MRTCIDRLIALAHIDAVRVRAEVDFIQNTLEQARSDGNISNDAFLDAGVIHGALSMLATHLDLGVSQKEIQGLLREQLDRATRLEQKHPGLNGIVESNRG